jgi:hypothetical protein
MNLDNFCLLKIQNTSLNFNVQNVQIKAKIGFVWNVKLSHAQDIFKGIWQNIMTKLNIQLL